MSERKENEIIEKEVPYERVVFFTDAVVAIAITLLALDLRLEGGGSEEFTFHQLIEPWRNYLAFALSFLNIASFWRTHHSIFTYTYKMNNRILLLNTGWLFFIVVLPFSTSVLSSHFDATPAVFLYSLNIFMISVLQNTIWDYVDTKTDFVHKEMLTKDEHDRFRLMFNLDMLNGLVAIIVSFFSPIAAFILLFFKIPTFVMVTFYIGLQRRKALQRQKPKKRH